MPYNKPSSWLKPVRLCTLALLLIVLAVGLARLFNAPDRDVWRAVIVALPDKVTTREISSTSYYIIKQTHEPVFRKDDGYNYTSKILRQWSRSIDYTSYTLCPDTSLLFDETLPLSFDLFKRHILDVTAKFDESAIVSEGNRCLTVKFSKPSRRYMDFLSAYANSPTIATSSTVEVGLGPFIVDRVTKDEIALRRKRPVSHGFNRIMVYDYKGAQDSRLKEFFISDYNFVSTRKGLELPESKYVRFENMSLKSMVLLINLPDPGQRRILYNCISIDMLRKAFSAGAKKFTDVQTILPIGVPGGRPGRPQQACVINKADIAGFKPIVLANWRSDNIVQLEDFAKEFFAQTGIRIKIINYPAAQLAGRMHDKPKPYNLIVIMTGPDSDDNFRLLASYFGKNSLLDFKIPKIEKLYGDLTKEDDPEKQKDIAGTIAERIARSHSLLPLYQSGASVYYPREIKNIVVGRELLEYPEVADFRW